MWFSCQFWSALIFLFLHIRSFCIRKCTTVRVCTQCYFMSKVSNPFSFFYVCVFDTLVRIAPLAILRNENKDNIKWTHFLRPIYSLYIKIGRKRTESHKNKIIQHLQGFYRIKTNVCSFVQLQPFVWLKIIHVLWVGKKTQSIYRLLKTCILISFFFAIFEWNGFGFFSCLKNCLGDAAIKILEI